MKKKELWQEMFWSNLLLVAKCRWGRCVVRRRYPKNFLDELKNSLKGTPAWPLTHHQQRSNDLSTQRRVDAEGRKRDVLLGWSLSGSLDVFIRKDIREIISFQHVFLTEKQLWVWFPTVFKHQFPSMSFVNYSVWTAASIFKFHAETESGFSPILISTVKFKAAAARYM